jgi:hypothetical protein
VLDAEIVIQSGFFVNPDDGTLNRGRITEALEMAIANSKVGILKLMFEMFNTVVRDIASEMSIGAITYGSNAEEVQEAKLDVFKLLYPLTIDKSDAGVVLDYLVQRENVQLVKEVYTLVKTLPGVDLSCYESIAAILNNQELLQFFKDNAEEEKSRDRRTINGC